MDAFTLIESTSAISGEEEFEEKMNAIPPVVSKILRIAIEHLGDEIDFSFAHP